MNTIDVTTQRIIIFILGIALIALIFLKQYQDAMYIIILFATLLAPKALSDKESEVIENHIIKEYDDIRATTKENDGV